MAHRKEREVKIIEAHKQYLATATGQERAAAEASLAWLYENFAKDGEVCDWESYTAPPWALAQTLAELGLI